MPSPSLLPHYRELNTTTGRSAAIASLQPAVSVSSACGEFDRATMTSLVPIYRLMRIPANLTPGAVQAIVW